MNYSNKTTENVSKKSTKKFIFIIVGVLIIVCLGGLFYYLQKAVASRDNHIVTLDAKANQLDQDKKSLSSKNANLEKVVQTLQNQLDKNGQTASSSDDQTQSEKSPTKPVARLVLRIVKDQPGTDFTIPGHPEINGNLRVVYLTITNLTGSAQTYDHFQFEATLNTGIIVKPRVYSIQDSTNWNSSKLEAGASQDIALLFGTDQNLVTLNWSPTGAVEPLIVTVPTPIPVQ